MTRARLYAAAVSAQTLYIPDTGDALYALEFEESRNVAARELSKCGHDNFKAYLAAGTLLFLDSARRTFFLTPLLLARGALRLALTNARARLIVKSTLITPTTRYRRR